VEETAGGRDAGMLEFRPSGSAVYCNCCEVRKAS